MAVVLGGVLLIASMLIVTMAVPLVYYLKRDAAWLNSDRSVAAWYA